MKKLLIVFLIIFTFSTQAEVITNFSNMCGNTGYRIMYAVPKSFTCSSGTFLPANSTTCYACPSNYTCSGGTFQFSPTKAQGIVTNTANVYSYTNNNRMCSSNMVSGMMYAVPKSFTCSSGTFLPANSTTCYACPSDYTCSGGTFQFSPTKAQGIIRSGTYISIDEHHTCSSNMGHIMNGTFSPNVHTCSPGYYLPANTDGCTICPENNKCIGGIHAFNKTTDQGIEQCTTEPHAPTGSDRCYPHILHINEEKLYMKSVKGTTPSLNAGVPGVDVCYANMVTTPTKLNKDSTHELRAIYEGVDYWICDDTICPDAE